MTDYCEKCKEDTMHTLVRKFKTLKGQKLWIACDKCNNIKVRVIDNDN